MGVGYKFDPEWHAHTYDGKRMYGVTSVLKLWGDPNNLLNWAVNQAVDAIKKGETLKEARTAHTRKRDKARDRGTKIHESLEEAMSQWIETGKRPTVENILLCNQVLEYLESQQIIPLSSEMPVYSLQHWYAGIMDGLVERDGKKYVLDFKTSGTIQTKYWFQLGAYSYAYKEMKDFKETIHGAIIIHIPRGSSFNSRYNVLSYSNMTELEKGWLNIYNTFVIDKKLEKLCGFKNTPKPDGVKS